jgi:integrase
MRPKAKKLPGGKWRIDFRLPGDRTRRYRRTFSSRSQAEDFLNDLLGGLPDSGGLTAILDEYLEWSARVRGKSAATVQRDKSRLGRFIRWAEQRKISQPRDITFPVMADFQKYFFENAPFDRPRIRKRYRPPNTPANWDHYRQNIAAFLNWCQKRRLITENPAVDPDLRVKLAKKIPPHFKPDELRAIFKYFDDRDRAEPVPWFSIMFRLLAYSGLRLGEARNLRWRNLDLKANRLTIEISKNKTARVLPIAPALPMWLNKLPLGKPDDYLFGDGNGGRLYTESWLLRQLVEATEALGMERRRIHDFRHSFAASLARNRVSIAEIQKLLGHKQITSTMIYIAFFPDDLKDAISKLDF